MATRRGRHGRLYIGTCAIVGLSDVTVANPHSMLDTTVMGDYYATQKKDIQGPWSLSFSAKSDPVNFGAMFDYSQDEDMRQIKFYPDTSDLKDYFYGDGVMGVDSSASMGDTVNWSGTVDGTGRLRWFTT